VPIAPEAAHYLHAVRDRARPLLSIDFSEADHARMQELMDKSNEGALIADEKAELDGYVNIANVLSVMHSRARAALRKSGSVPLRDPRNS
jgi:hypothetical protein